MPLLLECKHPTKRAYLSRTAATIRILVLPTVDTTKGAAEDNVLFIYSIITRHVVGVVVVVDSV